MEICSCRLSFLRSSAFFIGRKPVLAFVYLLYVYMRGRESILSM